MTNMAVYIFLLAAAAAAAALIYAYNRRLDRIARGEIRGTHNSIPEPQTAVGSIYRICLMVIAVSAFLNISALNGKVSSLQHTVNDLHSQNSSLMTQIYELQEQMKQSTGHVSSFSWQIGEPDMTSCTVSLSVAVGLKEYTDDTAVFLRLNGKEMPLAAAASGLFETEITADLFADYTDTAVLIREEGRTVSEAVDFPEDIFWDCLPMPSMNCSFSSGARFGKTEYDGSYTMVMSHKDDIESVTVTYMSGGKDLKTIDVTEQALKEETITLEQGLDIEKDLTFRTEITTKSGFRITERSVMIYTASPEFTDNGAMIIQDRNGNTLWQRQY